MLATSIVECDSRARAIYFFSRDNGHIVCKLPDEGHSESHKEEALDNALGV